MRLGYRIVYGEDIVTRQIDRPSRPRMRMMIAACLLSFSLLVRSFWPVGCELLKEVLLPDRISATQAAAEGLVQDVRERESFGDALTAFCEQLIAERAES